MGEHRSSTQPPRRFCSAPWVEGILQHDGVLKACCHSTAVLGNWQEQSLAGAWHGERMQQFRRQIRDGEFPDDSCRKCYANRTNRSLEDDLAIAFSAYRRTVESFAAKESFAAEASAALSDFERLFQADPSQLPVEGISEEMQSILLQYAERLADVERRAADHPDVRLAVEKLRTIARVARAFWAGELQPSAVVPYRRVQIISRCNARCIQCIGLFTGSIVDGPVLDDAHLPEALAHSQDMIGFFHDGTELLFYSRWKEVTDVLRRAGVRTILFTNGILLTPTTIRHLVDHDLLVKLNVSVDGATRETIEKIRVNVGYEALVRNLRFLFEYAAERNASFPIILSFVLMQENAHELPDFVSFVESLRGEHRRQPCMISVQTLEFTDRSDYRRFLKKQHPGSMDPGRIQQLFQAMLAESQRASIPVYVAGGFLEEFVAQGCPLPKYLDPLRILEDGASDFDGGSAILGPGWHEAEGDPPSRWTTARAEVEIRVERSRSESFSLHLTTHSFHRPRRCRIAVDGVVQRELLIPGEPTFLALPLDLPAGRHHLAIEAPNGADRPSQVFELGSVDDRDLAFHVRGLEVV